MKEIVLNLNYLVDGVSTVIPTKMFYDQSDNEQIQNICFEFNLGEYNITSKVNNDIEYAIKYLQKSLPSNVSIACCQSCRYGNFCPYGNNDNEVFCFKDIEFNNKYDVCEFFSENSTSIQQRSRELLDFCTEYMPISHDKHYTYNDWELEL